MPLPSASKLLRWLALVAALVAINLAVSALFRQLTPGIVAEAGSAPLRQLPWPVLAGALLAYALIMAIPFAPAVEIGLSLLMVQGAAAAPFVHAATLAGLMLAWGFGAAFAGPLGCRFLWHLGLRRACRFIDHLKALDRAGRIALLRDSLPPRLAPHALKWRYPMLAVLVNLPGNSLIGGGGGILMLAGLSGVFPFPATLLTLAIATAPVPLLVWLMGPGILG